MHQRVAGSYFNEWVDDWWSGLGSAWVTRVRDTHIHDPADQGRGEDRGPEASDDRKHRIRHPSVGQRGRHRSWRCIARSRFLSEGLKMPVRHRERHRTEQSGWLRAAVLGANDGILSTASLVLGVAAATVLHRGDWGRQPAVAY